MQIVQVKHKKASDWINALGYVTISEDRYQTLCDRTRTVEAEDEGDPADYEARIVEMDDDGNVTVLFNG